MIQCRFILGLAIVTFSLSPITFLSPAHCQTVESGAINIKNIWIEGSFSSENWKNVNKAAVFNRETEYRKFLQQYNLIGMPQAEVSALLGNEDARSCYTLRRYSNGQWLGLYIHYSNQRADKWQLVEDLKKGPEVTSNVLWAGLNGTKTEQGRIVFYVNKGDNPTKSLSPRGP
jgi:hypothetical protein